MANELKMEQHLAIIGLFRQGWSYRRIAAELGVDRETVARHIRSAQIPAQPVPTGPPLQAESNAAIVIAGSGDPCEAHDAGVAEAIRANAAIVIAGSTPLITSSPAPLGACDAKPAPAQISSGRRSLSGPFRATIIEGLERGLTAQRIWQDLKAEGQFTGGYLSVQRFVRQLRGTMAAPFRRMECEPGDEAQIDFGRGALIVTAEGKRSRPHLFRIVLSHSRKAYSEVAPRQTTEFFLRCIENAFWHFGGVPRTLVPDNLKAAVLRADWHDPELNPKIAAFCQHYGTVLLPTRPRTPRHKGKVERGIGYAQSNAVKGRTFASLAEQNAFLQEWEASVADTRIHGTTRKQVAAAFAQEKPALLPLPAGRFPSFQEARRIVSRDGHVEVARAYYSAPPEFVGRTIWARWDTHTVRLFDQRMKQIAIHARREPGQFTTSASHIAPEKRSGIERGTAWWLDRAQAIGPHAGRWAGVILQQRGVHAVRVVIGLVSLARRHPAHELERACRSACSHGCNRLRDIRNLLRRSDPPGDQQMLPFIDEHPVIRPLSEYDKIIQAAFERTPVTPSNP